MEGGSLAFKIIRANLSHVDAIAPLFDAYRVFYKQPSDLDASRNFIRERLTNDESIIALAIPSDQEETAGSDVRGLGFTQLYPSFSSTTMKRLWILNDLFVAPEARKHGLGGALLDWAKDFALERGAKCLKLATQVENVTAQSVYHSHGYVRDTEFYHYVLPLDTKKV